jgi:hypothetical protein
MIITSLPELSLAATSTTGFIVGRVSPTVTPLIPVMGYLFNNFVGETA